MLTSKAQRIFCYNVTCVASKKSCSSRSHLSGCFKCSSLLACKAARGTAFNLFSNSIVLLVYTLHLPSLSPADCFQEIIFVQEGNSHWNKLGFFRTYQVTNLLCGRMKVPHLMSIRLMECWLAMLNASSATMSHSFAWMSFQTCPWRGYLPGCFNALNFPLTRMQISTRFQNSLAHMQLRSNCVLPTAFKKLCSDKPGSVYWTKAGSKCDAFGTDMRSRMSAPGTSCSKETVLRIEFMMDHHRDY